MTYHPGPAFTLFLVALVSLSAACSDSSSGDTLGAYIQDASVTKGDAASMKGDSGDSGDGASDSSSDSSVVVVTGEKVVTYDVRQGVFTGPASVKVKGGETVSKPTAPTRPAYVFTGWYTEESEPNQNETTRFKFKDEANVAPSSVTSDITLYAGWRRLGLQDVVEQRKLPSDLSLYDEVTQAALGAYKAEAAAGASVSAVFVTVNGGSGAGKRDGTSWETAWAGSQLKEKLEGIDASPSHVYLFLVAAGVYKAGADSEIRTAKNDNGDVLYWLAMKNDVAIVGGWDGTSGSGSWKRGPAYVTDFKGGKAEDKTQSKQYSVFYSKDLNDKATLAYAKVSDASASGSGGGMFNDHSSPILTNVTFSKNDSDNGGGMLNDNSSPVLMNVTFSGNSSSDGGGMFNYRSSPVLMSVTFSGNKASGSGGGMRNLNSSPVLTNLTFSDNRASYGGGMHNLNSSPVLTNVTFFGNTADIGGGMLNDNNNSKATTVVNSIFWGNTLKGQTQSSQIYLLNDKGSGTGPENINLYNCIVQGGITQSGAQTSPLSLGKVGGGISVFDPSKGDPINITYANVYGEDEAHNPKLLALADNGGSVPTMALGDGSFAINTGVYITQKGSNFYYSNDGDMGASSGATWYLNTHPSLATSSTPPVQAMALPAGPPININLTATDARGYTRVGRPDIGAYEFGGVAP